MMYGSREKGADNLPAPLLRKPRARDGVLVADLIADCPPLDQNSLYCNLLQCTDFSDTCILAEREGVALGWISGYRLPDRPSTLFIWQVAVHREARGLGLARKMLLALLERPELADVNYLRTTITPDNDASRALFRSIAKRTNTALRETEGFDLDEHFRGRHDSERLITIGPMPRKAIDGVESESGQDRSAA